VAIRPGTQSGQVIRLKGEGVPHLKGFGRGDLLVEVVVKTPENLTKRQQELLREFAQIDKSKKSNQSLFKFWRLGDKAKHTEANQ
jgi:molecular chaperone DnaJ